MSGHICPNCRKELNIGFDFFGGVKGVDSPVFKTWKEKWAYGSKKIKLNHRQKDCFICPFCKEELIIFFGKLTVASAADELFIDTVHCSVCDRELTFRRCYKELGRGGYKFYCKECEGKKFFYWPVIVTICSIAMLVFYLIVFVQQ